MSSSPRISLKLIVVFSICVALQCGLVHGKSAPAISATGKNSPTVSAKSAQPAVVEDQIQEESRVTTQSIHMQAPPPPKGSSFSPSSLSTSASSQQPQYKHYPLHSDVKAESSHHEHYTKTKVSHGYHNEMVNMLLEVFGFAIVPILVLPAVGLALCYLLWSARAKQNHYAFDHGSTYGGGQHSSVVGYDYGHLNKKNGLERANNELTQRILPHL